MQHSCVLYITCACVCVCVCVCARAVVRVRVLSSSPLEAYADDHPLSPLFLFLVNRQQAHGLLERERDSRRLDLRKLIISITSHCASALFCPSLPSSSPLVIILLSPIPSSASTSSLLRSIIIITTITITESEGGGGGADGSSQVSPPPPPPARHHLLSPGSTHTSTARPLLPDFHSYVWNDIFIADLSRSLQFHLHLHRRLLNSRPSSTLQLNSSSLHLHHLQRACVSLCF